MVYVEVGKVWIKRQILNVLVIHVGDHIMRPYTLEIIEEDGLSDQKVEVRSIMRSILSFEFVFVLYLMKNILGITKLKKI